jgi:ATP-dependent RNA helicase RhlE
VVATPGRLNEHIRNNTINMAAVSTLVVDEVDTMLAMGFLEDIEKIFAKAHPKRQILMFSATLNQNVKRLAKEFLDKPAVVEVVDQRSSVDLINQQIVLVDDKKKAEVLSYLIGSKNYESVLVFVNTKKQADLLVEHLELDGLKAACIHGDIRQTARAKALRKLKENQIKVLVATDIAARGIDIEKLPVVINYALPQSITDYTHRIGRTGRAGNLGEAVTLLCVRDYPMMAAIEKELIIEIPRETIDGFELEEKQPRKVIPKVKAHEFRKKNHEKKEPPKKKTKLTTLKKRKTTKRDGRTSNKK